MKSRNATYAEGFMPKYRAIGSISAWAVCILLLAYIVITILGFLSLKSPEEPIGDPFFTLMELLTLLIAPLMLMTMVTVNAYARPNDSLLGHMALLSMALMTAITSCVHFVVLAVGGPKLAEASQLENLLFSFTWPSVVYALDILAWDWFFGLSMLFAAPIFKAGRLEKALRALMITSGVLSLLGLIGVPMENMQLRNIGIVGYTVVALAVFLLLGLVFRKPNRSQIFKN